MGWVAATGAAVGILVVAVSIAIVYALPKFRIIQKQIDDVNLIAREDINGLRVIKAFNAEPKRSKEFEKVNIKLTKTTTATGLVMISPFSNTKVTISLRNSSCFELKPYLRR